MLRSLKQLKALLSVLPGVTVLADPISCDGGRGCKIKARWSLKALRPTKHRSRWDCGTDGNYCYIHIVENLRRAAEADRVNNWLDQHGWPE